MELLEQKLTLSLAAFAVIVVSMGLPAVQGRSAPLSQPGNIPEDPPMTTSEHVQARQSATQSRKLLPVDEAAKDPSFKAFRDMLIDAVKRKDTQFILSVVAPNIENDFGGGNGIENFKAKWRLGKTADSPLWAELDSILSMGGSFRVEEGKRSFWAPYVYSAWPDDFDCGEDAQCYAVTAEHVNVRREPASTAPIVASLSYDIVKSKVEYDAKSKTPDGWTRIMVPGGGAGYIATKFISSPIDYRAGFAKVRGKWLMIALIAGD